MNKQAARGPNHSLVVSVAAGREVHTIPQVRVAQDLLRDSRGNYGICTKSYHRCHAVTYSVCPSLCWQLDERIHIQLS